MSDDDPREQYPDETGPRGTLGTGGPQHSDAVVEDPADGEPEGTEVLLPRSNWLRIAWVFVAVLWVLAMVAIFAQSCIPR
jgi:hypothetical protein